MTFFKHHGGDSHGGMGGGCGGGHGGDSSDERQEPRDEEEKQPLLGKPDAHVHAGEPAAGGKHRGC